MYGPYAYGINTNGTCEIYGLNPLQKFNLEYFEYSISDV